MIWYLIGAVLGILLYRRIGWRYAVSQTARHHAEIRAGYMGRFPLTTQDGGFDSDIQHDVRKAFGSDINWWPLRIMSSNYERRVNEAMNKNDPARLQRRITELERELGIGDWK